MRIRKKHVKRIVTGALLLFILYIILGATLPFISAPEVSGEYASSFNTEDFYGAEECGERVMLLETNDVALDERIRLINRAEKTIYMSTFDFKADEGGRDIMAMLLHAADNGVEVKLLVDGVSCIMGMEGKKEFYALSSHDNIEIKIYNKPNLLKPWTAEGRLHDKYIIVDGQAYILGGRNTRNYFLGFYQENLNHDRDLLVYNSRSGQGTANTENGGGSSLETLLDYFWGVWELDCCRLFRDSDKLAEKSGVKEKAQALRDRYTAIAAAKPELFTDFDYSVCTLPANRITLLSNPTHIMSKEPYVFYALAGLMKTAREDVLIHTPYAICDSYMYDELKEVCDAVPSVRMLINAPEGGANAAGCADYLWSKDKLLGLGLTIYEYNGAYSFHAKTVLIDDRLSAVGSYNFDIRSTYLDTELMLVVDSTELNSLLRRTSEQYENSSRYVLSADEYTLPEGYTEKEMPFGRSLLLHVIGFVLRPFRFLL